MIYIKNIISFCFYIINILSLISRIEILPLQSLLSTKNFDEKNEVPWKITQFIPFCVYFTTRKPAKTNRITDGNISSVIITDGLNSISKSVGIYRPYLRRTIHIVWKDATAWWRGVFSDDFTDGMTEGFKLR